MRKDPRITFYGNWTEGPTATEEGPIKDPGKSTFTVTDHTNEERVRTIHLTEEDISTEEGRKKAEQQWKDL